MKLGRTMIVQLGLVTLFVGGSAQAFTGGKDYAPHKPADVRHIPDATPQPEPFSQYGNPETYVVNGKRYRVKKDNKDHIERGTASWYGMKFHGKTTSSGEVYDIYGMTAAHKTLPIPTYATVTNLKNGKSVLVKINDRGPFVDDRVIDLSFAAAKKLDIVANGTAPVEIKTITFDDETHFAQTKHRFLQLGAFSQFDNAWQLRQKIKHIGQNIVHIKINVNQDMTKLYHVKVGPVLSQAHHADLVQQLRSAGLSVNHVLTSA